MSKFDFIREFDDWQEAINYATTTARSKRKRQSVEATMAEDGSLGRSWIVWPAPAKATR